MSEDQTIFSWEKAKAQFQIAIEGNTIIKKVFPEISFSLEHGVATFRREQTLCLRKDSETEFHFDYYINHVWYRNDCDKLREKVSRRNYEQRTYYNSDYWKQRTRITNKKELERDLADILKLIVTTSSTETMDNQVGFGLGAINANDEGRLSISIPVAICNNVTVEDVLKKNLKIPVYQRPYCWRERNVKGFLNDITQWQASKGVCYHTGTVVLKQQSNGQYDIVDGQQRLTTLAILKYMKGDKDIKLLQSGKHLFKTEEIQALLRAKRVAESSDWKIDLSNVILSVVVLGSTQPDDSAYTFFNSSNSTGKRLSDYDLLKTHHLRYVSTDKESEVFSRKWHQLEQSGKMDDLLQKMLFRLRKWNNKEWFAFESNERDSHDLFNHFKSVDPLPNFPLSNQLLFRFNSRLTGGREFFSYAEYYSKKYNEFTQLEAIKSLEKHLKWHSYGVICDGIKAISFLFYSKFGDIYLKEAVYLLAYRLSVLRNEYQIRCSFLGDKDRDIFSGITQVLDQVTSEAQFFAFLSDVKARYSITNKGQTATWYWNALKSLMEDLSAAPFALDDRIQIEINQEGR